MGDRRALLILALVLVLLLLQVPNAYSEEPTPDDKLSDFLSGVVGLDMTKYTSLQPTLPPDPRYPEEFGGLVGEQVLSPKFEYNESQIELIAIFYNNHMSFLKIYSYSQDDYVYSELPPTDIFSQTKSIIQRYQTFASQNYEKDTSYLMPMQDILNGVDDLTPMEFTDGNVNFQVSKDGHNTRIQWIYTEGGISMDWKRVTIKFRNNNFVSFWDTWGLYSVSGLSVISSEEVVQIAREAAHNYEISVGYVDRESEIVKVPDLSNAPYGVGLTMVPYRYNEDYNPSRIERDPLTLYPYWAVLFHFNETIAGLQGMEVGVWGDTGEIIYCSGFGYLGPSEPPTEEEIPEFPPWIILPIFIIAAIFALIIKKKLGSNFHKT